MSSISKVLSMATKKNYIIGANIIIHGLYTLQGNAENNMQKERKPRGILVNLEVHTGNQPEQGRTLMKQNPIQILDIHRLKLKQGMKFISHTNQMNLNKGDGDTPTHLGDRLTLLPPTT